MATFASPETAVSTTIFDPQQYLWDRDLISDFVMVEFGHGGRPVAYQQAPFLAGRSYIGMEGWLRDPWGLAREHIKELESQNPVQNIHYLSYETGGTIIRPREGEDSYYEGIYDFQAPREAGIADEILLSNVLGDPHIAYTDGAPENILGEIGRLLAPSGVAVLRETISFWRAERYLEPHFLEPFDLRTLAQVSPIDSVLWQELEAQYDGHALQEDGTIELPRNDVPSRYSDDCYVFFMQGNHRAEIGLTFVCQVSSKQYLKSKHQLSLILMQGII